MARKNTTERKSMVKGVWVNVETMERNEFSYEVEYVRTTNTAKALKLVSELINPDNDPNIAITVQEIVNESTTRKYYDNATMYVEALQMCMTREDAENELKEGEFIVKGTLYNFETQVFAYNLKANAYVTEPFSWSCGNNVTARDARAMLAMRYEEINPDERVICVHDWNTSKGYSKAQNDVWFILNDEIAQRCIKEDSES